MTAGRMEQGHVVAEKKTGGLVGAVETLNIRTHEKPIPVHRYRVDEQKICIV